MKQVEIRVEIEPIHVIIETMDENDTLDEIIAAYKEEIDAKARILLKRFPNHFRYQLVELSETF